MFPKEKKTSILRFETVCLSSLIYLIYNSLSYEARQHRQTKNSKCLEIIYQVILNH